MILNNKKTIADLLIANIPRDLLMGVEDALQAGAIRGFNASKGMNEGHLSTVLGQMRHFHMNEAFNEALIAANGKPTPIKGNSIVVGQAGLFRLSRFNTSSKLWNNGRRSRFRREMAETNRAIEQLIQPSLFDLEPITQATAFFVASFSGSTKIQPEAPQAIHIAVPDKRMSGWLFKEPLGVFLARYDEVQSQNDTAMPTLKQGIIKEHYEPRN